MNYVIAARSADIAPGQMKPVTVEGKKLLVANVGGAFYALAQKCPHLGGNLCKGTLDGATVTCPLHGAKFDVKTGEALGPAKILFLKMNTKGATPFPVKIEGGQVMIGV
jgi:nitrite reductase/ring-hydroxylating ferredoxin subunit